MTRGDRIGGLLGSVEWRRDDGAKWQSREPFGDGRCLRLADVIEEYAG